MKLNQNIKQDLSDSGSPSYLTQKSDDQLRQSSSSTTSTSNPSTPITEENVMNFLSGYKNLALTKIRKAQPWIEEMVEYRAFLCNDCLNNGRCQVCRCSTPGMFYAPLKKDSRKRWPTIADSDEWESFKSNDPNYQKYLQIKQQIDESNN